MQVQILEQTIFNFLILGKSRFPPKKFYNINFCIIERENIAEGGKERFWRNVNKNLKITISMRLLD